MYIDKQKLLEGLREKEQTEFYGKARQAVHEVIQMIESGAFDTDQGEVQRLQQELIKQTELSEMWKERYIAENVKLLQLLGIQSGTSEALSGASEQSGVDREHLRGDWIDEKCPDCHSQLLQNKVGDKWCSLIGCKWEGGNEG